MKFSWFLTNLISGMILLKPECHCCFKWTYNSTFLCTTKHWIHRVQKAMWERCIAQTSLPFVRQTFLNSAAQCETQIPNYFCFFLPCFVTSCLFNKTSGFKSSAASSLWVLWRKPPPGWIFLCELLCVCVCVLVSSYPVLLEVVKMSTIRH